MQTDLTGSISLSLLLLDAKNHLHTLANPKGRYRVSTSSSVSTVARKTTSAIETLNQDLLQVLQAQQKILVTLANRQGSAFDIYM